MGGRRIQAYTAIGRMDGACPYCVRDLPEWPTRSCPCPYCRREILVRSRPLDRERVLITVADEATLEDEWERYRERGGDQPLRPLLDEAALERERENLRLRYGREPGETDVAASLISHRAVTHMRSLELGDFRDLGLAKASIADQQGRWRDALAGYLGVCFLDLNGAHNPPRNAPGRVVAAQTGFDAARASLSQAVVGRLVQLLAILDEDEETVRSRFLGFCERFYRPFRTPRAPDEAWETLGDVLFDAA
jgi:hypothetical protein